MEHDTVVARPRNETGGESTNIQSRGYHVERYDELSSGRLKTVALTSCEVRAVVGTKGRHCHVEQSTSSVQLLSVENSLSLHVGVDDRWRLLAAIRRSTAAVLCCHTSPLLFWVITILLFVV